MRTRRTKVIAITCSKGRPMYSSQVKTLIFTIADQTPATSRSVTTERVKMPTRGSRGLRCIKSRSGGSTASASAGNPSVARLT
jgi:hypothetical protein